MSKPPACLWLLRRRPAIARFVLHAKTTVLPASAWIISQRAIAAQWSRAPAARASFAPRQGLGECLLQAQVCDRYAPFTCRNAVDLCDALSARKWRSVHISLLCLTQMCFIEKLPEELAIDIFIRFGTQAAPNHLLHQHHKRQRIRPRK